ncbi:MAG: DinB family protein [Candidatus Dormibacteria bacterium]
MVEDHPGEVDDEMLREFLRRQRESVLAIVDGLREAEWHRSVVPTGWTPAGMVEHLGGAEWHWFQGVVAGKQPELPGDVDEDQPPYDPLSVVFTSDASSAEVTTFYRDQIAQSEAVLATTSLSAPPLGKHGLGGFEPPNVRWVVLHMIEETARHVGHLDIARELLDGKVRLGGR